jgi:hypothetical protein
MYAKTSFYEIDAFLESHLLNKEINFPLNLQVIITGTVI